MDTNNERNKNNIPTDLNMVVKHHENKKNARNQEIKKTGHDRSNGKYFPRKVYFGNEITVVDKTWNCKGQGGCKK